MANANITNKYKSGVLLIHITIRLEEKLCTHVLLVVNITVKKEN
jgi:hypothetical protein